MENKHYLVDIKNYYDGCHNLKVILKSTIKIFDTSRAVIKGYGLGRVGWLVLWGGGHLNATKAKSIFYLPRSKKSKYTGMILSLCDLSICPHSQP